MCKTFIFDIVNAVRAQRPLVNEASGRSARTAFTFVKVDALHAQRPLLVQILPFALIASVFSVGFAFENGFKSADNEGRF